MKSFWLHCLVSYIAIGLDEAIEIMFNSAFILVWLSSRVDPFKRMQEEIYQALKYTRHPN